MIIGELGFSTTPIKKAGEITGGLPKVESIFLREYTRMRNKLWGKSESNLIGSSDNPNNMPPSKSLDQFFLRHVVSGSRD